MKWSTPFVAFRAMFRERERDREREFVDSLCDLQGNVYTAATKREMQAAWAAARGRPEGLSI